MEQPIKSFTLLECEKIFGSEYPLLNKVILHLSTVFNKDILINVINNDRATDNFHIVLVFDVNDSLNNPAPRALDNLVYIGWGRDKLTSISAKLLVTYKKTREYNTFVTDNSDWRVLEIFTISKKQDLKTIDVFEMVGAQRDVTENNQVRRSSIFNSPLLQIDLKTLPSTNEAIVQPMASLELTKKLLRTPEEYNQTKKNNANENEI